MRKTVFAAAATASLLLAPAWAQMVGGAGANVGQSPQDAGETDQTFDDLRSKGALQGPGRTDELALGAGLVRQEKFADAIPHLEKALERHPRDVTTLIYLGFAERMVGSDLSGDARNEAFAKALDYYKRGLAVDADNTLLHEYAGKLYVLMHDPASAKVELKKLQRLCSSGCQGVDELALAISTYEMTVNATGATQTKPPAQ